MGGNPSKAFEYLKKAGGIEGEDTYSVGKKERKCNFVKKNVKL